MSLINDALKRAKETQPKGGAPAAGPALRPVNAPRAERRTDYLLPLLVAIILLLAAVLFALWWQSGLGVVKVRAKSLPEAAQQIPLAENPKPAPRITAMPAPALPVATPPIISAQA